MLQTRKSKPAPKTPVNAYIPKDPETRHCIVCKQPFITTQPLRMFCSHVGPASCWRQLDSYTRRMVTPFHQALVRQRYECFNCHKTDAQLAPVVLRPDLVAILGGVMEEADIVAGCSVCKSEFYLTLSLQAPIPIT